MIACVGQMKGDKNDRHCTRVRGMHSSLRRGGLPSFCTYLYLYGQYEDTPRPSPSDHKLRYSYAN